MVQNQDTDTHTHTDNTQTHREKTTEAEKYIPSKIQNKNGEISNL